MYAIRPQALLRGTNTMTTLASSWRHTTRALASTPALVTVASLKSTQQSVFVTLYNSPHRRSTITRAVDDVAQGAVVGIDTTEFDTVFIDVATIVTEAVFAITAVVLILGTVAKVAFPEKFDAATYRAQAKKEVEKIDLDNLSEEDAEAVAKLEAELRKKGEL